MAALVETRECFPRPLMMGTTELAPAGEPRHEDCPKGRTIEGVIGGWVCPCLCHRRTDSGRSPQGGAE